MRLLLSSDALPTASFRILAEACRRRALSGLELTLQRGQGHGVDDAICPIKQNEGIRCIPDDPEVPVAWLRLPDDVRLSMLMVWAGEAHIGRAGILLSRPVNELPHAARFALVHGSDPAEAEAAIAWAEKHDARTSWEIGRERGDLALIDEVLRITARRLAHVRLLGAGPEVDGNGDRPSGTGMLLGRLALNGFEGTVSLAPGSVNRLPDWEHWLLNGRGWGCGTAAEKQARAQALRATQGVAT